MTTCGRQLASGQWWHFCGETDMGQGVPVQCEICDPQEGLKVAEGAEPRKQFAHIDPDRMRCPTCKGKGDIPR